MELTPYHARYFALLLTRRSVGVERYLPALSTASIDLHPHQIDAAVFATRSPFRDGVILADEEGLGKTVEAGIALLQAYLEKKTRLLVLCPPPLVEYWRNELRSKFSLPVVGLDELDDSGGVVVLSYQKAYRQAGNLAAVPWDLCVLDEAHLIANAGPSGHMQANALQEALHRRPKYLVTATPMQNSLLDLYYLVRFIDDTTFPSDPEDFRARYMARKTHRDELANRAQMLCQRTLRRQALTMPFIKRTARTIIVPPSPEEEALSRRLSLYFHRENLVAFPRVKEHRIRLTYWKMLASSPSALHASLLRLCERLADNPEAADELRELREIAAMTERIAPGSRATVFLDALNDAIWRLREAGVPERAVIFSENTDTLDSIRKLLCGHGYRPEDIVGYYGGSRSKHALHDFTHGKAHVLLATDGSAAGLDISQCALVINYDLPWNVQKLEQRISRCHRYGQQHDVLVLNFIDPTNRADRRLYDSINKKLKRFDDLFGASETILGQLAGAGDPAPEFRTEDAIQADRVARTADNLPEIEKRVEKAEADILAHFDDEVRQRFAKYGETIPAALSRMDYWLWELTRYRLHHRAAFDEMKRSFVLDKSPYQDLRLQRITYGMDRSLPPGERYLLGHPLARRILADCLEGIFEHGSLTLVAGSGFSPGLSGELGLWQIGMMSEVTHATVPVLCGVTDGGEPLTHDDCAGILKLEVISCEGGPKWDENSGETYRGRTWRGAAPAEDGRPSIRNRELDALRDQAMETARQRLAMKHDEVLQTELARLRQWAEDEETALKERQEDLRRRIADAKSRLDKTSGYVQRFQANQRTAELEKERRREEERLFMLAAEVRRKRDERMEEAKLKSKCRFWDEEMFVVNFKVMDNGENNGKSDYGTT